LHAQRLSPVERPSPVERLVVMARWPAPGRCKSRLAAGCGAERAAWIQERLTSHTLQSAVASCASPQRELRLAVEGLGRRGLGRWQRALAHQGLALEAAPQGAGNLGCRMQRELRLAFAAGREAVVLVGTDLPSLEPADLALAFAALQEQPCVIGPASDGGYWLLGLRRDGFALAGAALMGGMPWGSDQVLQATLQAAQRRQLPVQLLREQSDLDQIGDLAAWLRCGPLLS